MFLAGDAVAGDEPGLDFVGIGADGEGEDGFGGGEGAGAYTGFVFFGLEGGGGGSGVSGDGDLAFPVEFVFGAEFGEDREGGAVAGSTELGGVEGFSVPGEFGVAPVGGEEGALDFSDGNRGGDFEVGGFFLEAGFGLVGPDVFGVEGHI